MLTIPELAAEALGSHLAERMSRRFGSTDAGLIEGVQSAARLALDCIGNSDALYHNVEHTMLVTLVGYDILSGRQLSTETTASDFAHVIIACLFHDIGYVRGILNGDSADGYIVDGKGNKAELPRGASDAALKPYHVDRSKLFVLDRVAKDKSLDATRIANAIECTRSSSTHGADDSDGEEGMLLRAADLIGQLGDPHMLRKANALYYEFEEVGMNKQLGYTSPADLTDLYPKFFWTGVSPHVQSAIRYLNVTSSGRQWIANLHSNIFRAERELSLSGPQR
ncbi:MAG: metal-dependent phosphohydrolase [Pseudolabrys sp.]